LENGIIRFSYYVLFEFSQHMQTMDEEKAKLDAFCEQSLKEVGQVTTAVTSSSSFMQ